MMGFKRSMDSGILPWGGHQTEAEGPWSLQTFVQPKDSGMEGSEAWGQRLDPAPLVLNCGTWAVAWGRREARGRRVGWGGGAAA